MRLNLLPKLLACALAFCFQAGNSCDAGLMISGTNSNASAGGTGVFDIELSNTELAGGSSFAVSAFTFDISISPGSGIQFTDAVNTGTTNPYIFAGNSFADASGAPLSFDPFPNTGFIAFDATNDFSDVTVAPGDTFALARVSYSVAASATSGSFNVQFGLFTELADSIGNLVPIESAIGPQITVSGGSTPTVPEPASVIIWILCGICLAASGWYSPKRRLGLQSS